MRLCCCVEDYGIEVVAHAMAERDHGHDVVWGQAYRVSGELGWGSAAGDVSLFLFLLKKRCVCALAFGEISNFSVRSCNVLSKSSILYLYKQSY